MNELLPAVCGTVIGVGTMRLSRTRWRWVTLLSASLLTGAAASVVNGELARDGWYAFVSADALMVWLGATAAPAIVACMRRLNRRRIAGGRIPAEDGARGTTHEAFAAGRS
jgi:hypothetical protein